MSNQAPATFGVAFQQFHDDTSCSSRFNAACRAFLAFDQPQPTYARLTILYILHALYAQEPLESNPFLTFFLDFAGPDPKLGDAIEQHFVHCILEGSISNVQDCTPQDVCRQPGALLPTVMRRKERLDSLRHSVSQLLDDPKPLEREDDRRDAEQLLQDACVRPLTDAEATNLSYILQRQSVDTLSTYQIASKLPRLVEYNGSVAAEIIPPLLARVGDTDGYLQPLVTVPATPNSLQLVYHLLQGDSYHICPRPSPSFLHAYVSHCILSCERLGMGVSQDQLVKTVAKFLQRLLSEDIIPMAEYHVEIRSFCVEYLFLRLGAVTTLFRKVSADPHWVEQPLRAGPSSS